MVDASGWTGGVGRRMMLAARMVADRMTVWFNCSPLVDGRI
jgi:hypothetical protein